MWQAGGAAAGGWKDGEQGSELGCRVPVPPVTAPSEARTSLPAKAASAALARRFVDHTLTAWGLDGMTDTATLLVSELVANAILHARTQLEVVMRQTPAAVRIEVHDSNARLPARKHYSEDAATGRGLLLVETLADGWGADPTAEGKAVWFEIGVQQSASRSQT